MKLLADENISSRTVAFLRDLGFDTVHVREIGLRGKPDQEVMDYAVKEGRLLLTIDSDFADIRKYSPGTHGGIIRMRLKVYSSNAVNACLELLLKALVEKDVKGNLVITDGEKYRVRRKK